MRPRCQRTRPGSCAGTSTRLCSRRCGKSPSGAIRRRKRSPAISCDTSTASRSRPAAMRSAIEWRSSSHGTGWRRWSRRCSSPTLIGAHGTRAPSVAGSPKRSGSGLSGDSLMSAGSPGHSCSSSTTRSNSCRDRRGRAPTGRPTRPLEYLDSLAAESADDPTLRAELARAYPSGRRRAGRIPRGQSRQRDWRAGQLSQGPGVAGASRRGESRRIASAARSGGNAGGPRRRPVDDAGLPAALDSFRRALAIREALSANGADRDLQRELAISHHRFGDVTRQLNDPKGAAGSLQRSIAIPRAAGRR